MKKILLTNHQLSNYAGSELVTFDLALNFKNRGWDVYVATFVYGGSMRVLFQKNNIRVFNVLDDALPTREFDLVWGHHFPVLIKCLVKDNVKTKSLILSSLSPYEPLEAIPFFYGQSDLILCNSEETKKELIDYSGFDKNKFFVFRNSVVSNFFDHSLDRDRSHSFLNRSSISEIKKIAVISNHPPIEIC